MCTNCSSGLYFINPTPSLDTLSSGYPTPGYPTPWHTLPLGILKKPGIRDTLPPPPPPPPEQSDRQMPVKVRSVTIII